MKLKIPVFFAVLLSLFGASIFAISSGAEDMNKQNKQVTFEELDANDDGLISLDESKYTWLANDFHRVDTDRDGYVTKSEYQDATS